MSSVEVAPSYSLRRSALTASQKLRNRHSPLKSVENQNQILAESSSMNGLKPGDGTTGVTIRSEPFTEHYSVEEEIGR